MKSRDGRRHCCGGREGRRGGGKERGREWLKEPGFLLLSFLKSAVQEERRLKQRRLLLKLDSVKEASAAARFHALVHMSGGTFPFMTVQS